MTRPIEASFKNDLCFNQRIQHHKSLFTVDVFKNREVDAEMSTLLVELKSVVLKNTGNSTECFNH